MQTLKIGRSTYTLSPSRNVGELQAAFTKCTGKFKRAAIKKDSRGYPAFKAGMSTADYVRAFYSLNFGNHGGSHKEFFAPLNTEPCALYSGEDLHEVLADDSEAAPVESRAAEASPAELVPAHQGAAEVAPAGRADPAPAVPEVRESEPTDKPAACFPARRIRETGWRRQGDDETAQQWLDRMHGPMRSAVYRVHCLTHAAARRVRQWAPWDASMGDGAGEGMRLRGADRLPNGQALRDETAAILRAERAVARFVREHPAVKPLPASHFAHPSPGNLSAPLTTQSQANTEDSDRFHCPECGHGWNCIDDTVRPATECPNCGHDTEDSKPASEAAPLEFVSRYTGPKCNGLSEVTARLECLRRAKAEPGFVFKVAPCDGSGLAAWQVTALRGKFEVQRWQATPAGGIPDAAPLTGDSEAARAAIDGMNALDLYDYLADYGAEPHPDLTGRPVPDADGLRVLMLEHIEETGPAVFLQRMQDAEASHAEEMAELSAAKRAAAPPDSMPATRTAPAACDGSAAGLAALLRASIESARKHQAETGRRRAPLLRIPAGDPRAAIPARFAPLYLLQGGAS